jgi:sulfite exporter TauE/SafE
MGEVVFWQVALAGIALGFAGSFHCFGMCGPLIMAMHGGQGDSKKQRMVFHHSGRALAYMCMLIAFLSIGSTAKGMGWQQGLSIFGGIIFILGWIPAFQKRLGRILFPVRNQLQKTIPISPLPKHFLQGLINGFLPCGWSISAIGAAMVYGNWEYSILFIVFFTVGNTPILWLTALGGRKILVRMPWFNHRWAKTSLMILGLLFILRGANLGIPYLSPKMEKEKMSCCSTH